MLRILKSEIIQQLWVRAGGGGVEILHELYTTIENK